MANPVYVVGHKNPDTDAIVSAIGYADLKRRTGMENAVAARLGSPWPETEYLLDRLGLPAPMLLTDVYTRVRDVMNPGVQFLLNTATMREAGPVMRDKRIVPVVDRERHLLGVVTLDDVAARYLQEMDLAGGASGRISFESLVRTLDGELVVGDVRGEWQGRVWVLAMTPGGIARVVSEGDMVVVGDRQDAQRVALEHGASCLVLVGDARPDPGISALAEERGARIIVTQHDSYRVTRLLNLSVPVSEVMRRDVLTAEMDDPASEVVENLSEARMGAMPVVDDQGKLVGILSRTDLLRARGKEVILVDHNHSAQAVEGLEQAHILEVIDHHNLGDLHTPEPILMKLEPVGSTSTIVAEMFEESGLVPTVPIAGALAGGIVSDTLLFRSPTCTPRDRRAAERLASISGTDLEKLAYEMFRANSNYEHTTPEQILGSNLKVYEWGGRKVGIGQAETVDVEYFEQHREEMLRAMREMKRREGLDLMIFLATDILGQNSVAFVPEQEERSALSRAFGVMPRDDRVELPGVVSRKKQVVPPLTRELS